MLYRFFLGGLLLLSTFSLAVAQKTPFVEENIDGHRCLIVEPTDLPAQAPLVIVIHGLGGNATNLVRFFQDLHLPPCRAVFPDGIFPAPGAKPQDRAYSWYFPLFDRNRPGIEASRDHLFKLIDRYSKDPKGDRTRPVVFMGFSQGGVMSLEAGLNCSHKVLAIVDMSGYMPDPTKTMAKVKAPRTTPILMIHGTQDPIVPIDLARRTQWVLIKAGYHPELKEFDMGHQLTVNSLITVHNFLMPILENKTH